MGSIRRVMAAAGIGMAQIDIRVVSGNHPRGTQLGGSVDITGGNAPQLIRTLELRFRSFYYSGDDLKLKDLNEIILAESVDVLPHGKKSFPFSLRVPDAAVVTRRWKCSQAREGCRLEARAEIDCAIDPRCTLVVDIAHHREAQALQAAMRDLAFSDHGDASRLVVNASPEGRFARRYRPPRGLAEQIDTAILIVDVKNGRTTGELVLDPRETTLREKMRAFVVTDYLSFPFSFEPGELLTADGDPNPSVARDRLYAILAEALVLPDNEKNRLLRPANPEPETLLRPAASLPSRPQDLLRPAPPQLSRKDNRVP